jgi:hypothetical protein
VVHEAHAMRDARKKRWRRGAGSCGNASWLQALARGAQIYTQNQRKTNRLLQDVPNDLGNGPVAMLLYNELGRRQMQHRDRDKLPGCMHTS